MSILDDLSGSSLLGSSAVLAATMIVACTPGRGTQSDPPCPEGERVDGECVVADGGDPIDGSLPSDGGADGAEDGRASQGDRLERACEQWSDGDQDGLACREDNCPGEANPDQTDSDGDGWGDACDNCPEVANAGQDPDACSGEGAYDPERDSDGDGVPDVQDNCPDEENSEQTNSDGDSLGDACDNCPEATNEQQVDSDDDGVGDACEEEPSGEICRETTREFSRVAPNIYFVVDRSSSMSSTDDGSETRMTRAKNGMDEVAKRLHDKVRIGLSTYPCPPSRSAGCDQKNRELLAMGDHGENEIIDAYRSNYDDSTCAGGDRAGLDGLDSEGYGAGNWTPTGAALEDVRKNQRYLSGSDPDESARTKRLVLLTDGGACNCGDGAGGECGKPHPETLDELRQLRDAGIKTFVIGFNFDNDTVLNEAAEAGGTDAGGSGGRKYYTASTASDLADVVSNIEGRVGSCTLQVEPGSEGIDPEKIWVEVDGTTYPAESYDPSSQNLNLGDQACSALQDADAPEVRVVAGCPTECESSEEVCDYEDNDCDGEVDENCQDCTGESCNGEDDDCDGEVDEGCPDCVLQGESCSTDADCCNGVCTDEEVCGLGCRPVGAPCESDDECCNGTCSKSGGETGSCVSG